MLLTSDKTKYIRYYTLYCIALYIVLSIFFLQTGYVEGDDARTILYHLMGRDKSIQPPYSPYHSGFDYCLSFLPPHEPLLRKMAIVTSFIFGGIVFYLIGILLILLTRKSQTNQFIYLSILPFIIPEFIFNSSYYNPTNIGFAFALSAAIALIYYLHSEDKRYLLIYSMLFGLAIPFRWSLVFMLPAYMGFLLYETDISPKAHQIKSFLLYSTLALVTAVALIGFTGYTPFDIVNTFLWATDYTSKFNVSYLSLAANTSAYYTLPFVLCLFFAINALLKNKPELKKTTILLLLCFSPHLIMILFSGVNYSILYLPLFKYSVTCVPVLVLLGYWGFNSIKNIPAIAYTFAAIILFIWFCGVKVEASGMAYGPGFETKTFSSENHTHTIETDQRVKLKNVNIAFDAGLFMPTSDGPRPLMGYFYIIFGGIWRSAIDQLGKNRLDLIRLTQTQKHVLFQDSRTAYLQCDLYKMGYTASAYTFSYSEKCYSRTFISAKDTIQLHIIPQTQNKANWLVHQQKKMNKPVILHSVYSSLIADLAKQKNSSLLSTYSILIH